MRLPILVLHICAGILGLLSGAAALSFRKGCRWHRVAGNVFFVSMLGMSTAGAYLAFMKHQMNNVFGGVLAFYLVTTAWATGRRRDGETSIFDWGALLVALAVGAIILTYGFEVANSRTGPKDGIPAGMYFFSWFRGSAFCRWRRSHARARRGFRCTSHCATPLAHVLFPVHRHRILFPGTATSIPPLVTQNKGTFSPGHPATDIADFQAVSRSVYKCAFNAGRSRPAQRGSDEFVIEELVIA